MDYSLHVTTFGAQQNILINLMDAGPTQTIILYKL